MKKANPNPETEISNSYKCRHCGYVLPKKDATISGYDSELSLSHVHCPRCGKIVTSSP